MKIYKIYQLFTGILIVLILGYGLFQISKSRTFQFFGGLTSRVKTGEKVVALTFDDAPSESTADVLKILNDKNVKATFFVIGRELVKYPRIGKAIVFSGNELGNHTYSHERMVLKSPEFIADEIEKTNQLIRETGHTGEIFFRPPNGKKLFLLPWYLNEHRMKTIMWDVEPDTYGKTPDLLVNYTLKNTKPGSIILLHPFCNACAADREALPRIIDGLIGEGYSFVTVSELLKSALNQKRNN